MKHIKTLTEASQQALDAMEDFRTKVHEGRAKSTDSYDKFTIAVKDLRAALDDRPFHERILDAQHVKGLVEESAKPIRNHVEQFTLMAQARKDTDAFQALINKTQPL